MRRQTKDLYLTLYIFLLPSVQVNRDQQAFKPLFAGHGKNIFSGETISCQPFYYDKGSKNLKYFSIAARNRELVVINDMDVFAHYFCYTTKQKKGQVPESRDAETHGDYEEAAPVPVYEIEESTVSDDDDL